MQSPNEQSPWGQQPSNQQQTPIPPAYNDPISPPTGYPPGNYPGGPVDNSVNGTVVLVMGILGLLFCQIFAIVAWVMGNNALRTLDSGRGDQSQRQLVVVGRILGIIGTVLGILAVIFGIFVFIMLVVAGANAPRPTSPSTIPVPPVP